MLLALLAGGACTTSKTVVFVDVTGRAPGLDQMAVTVVVAGESKPLMVPQTPATITLPTSFTVEIPDQATGPVVVKIDALAQDAVIAHGEAMLATVVPRAVNRLQVNLGDGAADGGADGGPDAADGGTDMAVGPDPDAGLDAPMGGDGRPGVDAPAEPAVEAAPDLPLAADVPAPPEAGIDLPMAADMPPASEPGPDLPLPSEPGPEAPVEAPAAVDARDADDAADTAGDAAGDLPPDLPGEPAPGDGDGDGFTVADGDCDDTNGAIHPGAAEACNGVDDNCNGLTDEGVKTSYYPDLDTDGYGDKTASPTQACSAPLGFVTDHTDCNDGDTAVNPGATEVCDAMAVDENCNGKADDADTATPPTGTTTYYRDSDSDGYGDPATSVDRCVFPTGYVLNHNDCDDTTDAVHPGATEVCNGVDDNCNLTTDEGVGTSYYPDVDTDGYGDLGASAVVACTAPTGYVTDHTDCDDMKIGVHPGATEVCDPANVDENCNGKADDLDTDTPPSNTTAWYRDSDGDTYGDAGVELDRCDQPAGYVANATDCDDTMMSVHPGATEVCNGIDDNCNTFTDDADTMTPPTDRTTYYQDTDTDNYGNPSVSVQKCTMPAGYVTDATDCDDTMMSVNPGVAEVCGNAIDDNCNGSTDEGC